VKGLDKLVVLTDRDLSQWHEKGVNAIKISNFNTLNCDKKSDVTNNSVLAVGRLDYQKGFDTLIDIWARVNHKFPNWVLNIYGDGEWHEKLKCQIEKYRLSNSIILRGTSDDMVNVYNEHSIYVMTSRFEGLPMVLIEAMSFGLPVVSLNCEFGPSEIVKNGVNGFLIEPQNVDEFESMLCRLMDSVDLRRLYGENAVQTAYFFSKDRVMGQWLDLLANLKFK
jgi:glycosyltransferase involved in cell wall biosynthesis